MSAEAKEQGWIPLSRLNFREPEILFYFYMDSADNHNREFTMKESQIYAKIERKQRLFTLPEVLAQIIKATEDSSSSLESIAKIISKDVALTGRIMKIGNSSFYGRSQKVNSVREAIKVLGTRTVKSIALSVSVYDLCNRLENRLDLRDFWTHSLEIAIISEMIAEKIKYASPEEAFLAGLLHDMGILILDSTCPEEYEEIWKRVHAGSNLMETERSLLDTDHARVGAFVAARWHLPPKFVEVISDHHQAFDLAKIEQEDMLLRIISLASRTGKFSMYGLTHTAKEDFDNKNALLHSLGLTNDDFADIQSESVNRLIETAKLLEIEVGSALDLVQKANYLLCKLITQLEVLYGCMDEHETKSQQRETDSIATDVMHTVVATFSHYFNNACATILGRSQLLEMALKKNEITDNDDNILTHSIEVIQKGVQSITNVLGVMSSVESFETVQYHEKARIIDLKDQLDKLASEQLDSVASK